MTGETRKWIVTGRSMEVEADTADEAVDRAQDSSGWHWEAVRQDNGTVRPTAQVQRIIDLLDGIVDAGPTPASLAPVRTALVGLRDEPDEPMDTDACARAGQHVRATRHVARECPLTSRGKVVAQIWDSPVDDGYVTVQIDVTGEQDVNVDLNDGRLFHGNPNRADNTFEVIRQAALRYLHGEDGTGTPPLAEELATLADALGIPHADVEALG